MNYLKKLSIYFLVAGISLAPTSPRPTSPAYGNSQNLSRAAVASAIVTLFLIPVLEYAKETNENPLRFVSTEVTTSRLSELKQLVRYIISTYTFGRAGEKVPFSTYVYNHKLFLLGLMTTTGLSGLSFWKKNIESRTSVSGRSTPATTESRRSTPTRNPTNRSSQSQQPASSVFRPVDPQQSTSPNPTTPETHPEDEDDADDATIYGSCRGDGASVQSVTTSAQGGIMSPPHRLRSRPVTQPSNGSCHDGDGVNIQSLFSSDPDETIPPNCSPEPSGGLTQEDLDQLAGEQFEASGREKSQHWLWGWIS